MYINPKHAEKSAGIPNKNFNKFIEALSKEKEYATTASSVPDIVKNRQSTFGAMLNKAYDQPGLKKALLARDGRLTEAFNKGETWNKYYPHSGYEGGYAYNAYAKKVKPMSPEDTDRSLRSVRDTHASIMSGGDVKHVKIGKKYYYVTNTKQADDNGGSAIPAAVGGAALGAGGYFAYKHFNGQGPSLSHSFMNNKLGRLMTGAGGLAAVGAGLYGAAKQVGKHMAAQGIDKAMRAEKVTGASGATTVVNAAKKQEAAKTVVQDAKATTLQPKVVQMPTHKMDLQSTAAHMEKLNDAMTHNGNILMNRKTPATTSTTSVKVQPKTENKVVQQAADKKSGPDHSFDISEMNKLKGQVNRASYPASFSQPGSDAMPAKFIHNENKFIPAEHYVLSGSSKATKK